MNKLEILLVEDNLEDIDLTREALANNAVKNNLNVVYNGEEALHFLKKEGRFRAQPLPDLIIMDLNLPKRTGVEVIQEMHRDPALKNIPVVLLTVSELDKDFLKSLDINPDDYLHKDMKLEHITRLIHRIDEINKVKAKAETMNAVQTPPLKILLVEDNPDDATLLQDILFMKEKYSWNIKRVDRLSAAFDALEEKEVDVIVLDLFLPDSIGLETLEALRQKIKTIPVVVMTGLKDEQTGIEAVRKGAQDYLVKGQITADSFLRTIEYAIERQQLDQKKSEIIDFVNHEINNPLTVIREGISQVVEGLKGPINNDQRLLLQTALNGVERLGQIAEQLLDSTRLEVGKIDLNKERCNLVDVIKSIAQSFRLLAQKKDLQIKEQYSSEQIQVNIDKDRIAQVISNLLTNALKFTEQGSIDIAVNVKDKDVICVIKDTGRGISGENIPKVFGKFERFSDAGQKKVKGIGLGLYICKHLIELHKGSISVESKLNQGTTFVIQLPKE